jgi:hypothetical protein
VLGDHFRIRHRFARAAARYSGKTLFRKHGFSFPLLP